jgi:hypothetical protein
MRRLRIARLQDDSIVDEVLALKEEKEAPECDAGRLKAARRRGGARGRRRDGTESEFSAAILPKTM